jgi:hypothetical protein
VEKTAEESGGKHYPQTPQITQMIEQLNLCNLRMSSPIPQVAYRLSAQEAYESRGPHLLDTAISPARARTAKNANPKAAWISSTGIRIAELARLEIESGLPMGLIGRPAGRSKVFGDALAHRDEPAGFPGLVSSLCLLTPAGGGAWETGFDPV